MPTQSAIDLRNRYLWLVFPAMFAVVLAANVVLVYFALASWPGLAYENPSERGRKFNQVLQAEEKAHGLGWKFTLRYVDHSVEVRIVDASGAALDDLGLTGTLVRPLGGIADTRLAFGTVAPGVYRAPVDLVAPGQWEVRVAATRGEARAHEAQRFVVR